MKPYTNPIIPNGEPGRTADPFVCRHNGIYYHCYSTAEGVWIAQSPKLWLIGESKAKMIYSCTAPGAKKHWYAPELHFVDGRWYVYGAPVYDEKKGNHTMCVLQSATDDPMSDYEFKGAVRGLEDKWSIDGTLLHHEGGLYFVWTVCSKMFMAKMSSPLSLEGEAITLCRPEKPFETVCDTVNEGPAVLRRNGRLYIVYSANDSKCDDYCLGILTYTGGNVLDPASWQKSEDAVFKKTDKIFGPGHCSFTKAVLDGREKDFIVYHANLVSGSGWTGRSVWIKPFDWDENDFPVFGCPEF